MIILFLLSLWLYFIFFTYLLGMIPDDFLIFLIEFFLNLITLFRNFFISTIEVAHILFFLSFELFLQIRTFYLIMLTFFYLQFSFLDFLVLFNHLLMLARLLFLLFLFDNFIRKILIFYWLVMIGIS